MSNIGRTSTSCGARSLLALLLVACNSSDAPPPTCTGVAEPAVELVLTDAASGAEIAGASATLIDGAFTDAMREGPPGTYSGGFERPGTYRVEITADGYEPRTLVDIVAPATACGPDTQRLQVALQPTGSAVRVTIDVIELDDATTFAWMQVWSGRRGSPTRPGSIR